MDNFALGITVSIALKGGNPPSFAVSHRIEKEAVMHMLDWNNRQQLAPGSVAASPSAPTRYRQGVQHPEPGRQQKGGHLDERPAKS